MIICILLLSDISAKNISLQYTDEVEENKEFSLKVELINFENDSYDVKIDILGNNERVAKILNNGEWKSTYYYINDAIKENEKMKQFSLEIINYTGIVNMEIKIRNSKGTSDSFTGYSMDVIPSKSPETGTQQNSDDGSSTNDTPSDENTETIDGEKVNPNETGESEILLNKITISSSPKDIKSEKENSFKKNIAI